MPRLKKSVAVTDKSDVAGAGTSPVGRTKTEQSEYASNFDEATPTSHAKTEKSGARTERSEYEFEEATPDKQRQDGEVWCKN